jgi:hypothetical protein
MEVIRFSETLVHIRTTGAISQRITTFIKEYYFGDKSVDRKIILKNEMCGTM